VLSDRGLRDGLVTLPEEFYQVCPQSVIKCNTYDEWVEEARLRKKERKKVETNYKE